MTGKVIFTLAAVCLSACAQPKYVSREGVGQANAGAEKPVSLVLPKSRLRAWISWETKPSEEDFGSFFLKIGRANRADGSFVPTSAGGTLSVLLWMPSMGHGSSPVTLEEVDTGTYRVSDVFFTMPGDWEIRVQRTSEEFGVEEAALAIRI